MGYSGQERWVNVNLLFIMRERECRLSRGQLALHSISLFFLGVFAALNMGTFLENDERCQEWHWERNGSIGLTESWLVGSTSFHLLASFFFVEHCPAWLCSDDFYLVPFFSTLCLARHGPSSSFSCWQALDLGDWGMTVDIGTEQEWKKSGVLFRRMYSAISMLMLLWLQFDAHLLAWGEGVCGLHWLLLLIVSIYSSSPTLSASFSYFSSSRYCVSILLSALILLNQVLPPVGRTRAFFIVDFRTVRYLVPFIPFFPNTTYFLSPALLFNSSALA